ncbi:MAG: hypothetical protein HGB14_12815 [Anaerolineaceae bacterium]|nr:hypothetical protein [Anaerolineaceae bacterium]
MERGTLYAQRYKETPEAKGQEILFTSDSNAPKRIDLKILDFDEFPETEKFNLEKSVLGFYLTGHPLEKYRGIIKHFVNLTFGEDVAEIDFTKLGTVKMCGVISDLQVKSSKKGNKFAVYNLIDFYGTGECVAFSKLLEKKQWLYQNDALVFIEGKAEENGDKIKLIIENIHSIDTFQIQLANNVMLKIDKKILSRAPSPDTWSHFTSDEDFYLRMPYDILDQLLYAEEHHLSPEIVQKCTNLTSNQMNSALKHIHSMKNASRMLQLAPPVYMK